MNKKWYRCFAALCGNSGQIVFVGVEMKVSDGIFAYMANRENFRYQEKKNISSWWRKVEQIMVVVELGKEKQSKWTNGKQKMVRKLTEGNYLICVLEWKRRKKKGEVEIELLRGVLWKLIKKTKPKERRKHCIKSHFSLIWTKDKNHNWCWKDI